MNIEEKHKAMERALHDLNDFKNYEADYGKINKLINIINKNFNLYPELLIKSPLSYLPVDWGSYFKKIKFYDFDVKMCKMMCSGFDSNLNENGDNLALMLENILAGDDKRKFINLLYGCNLIGCTFRNDRYKRNCYKSCCYKN